MAGLQMDSLLRRPGGVPAACSKCDNGDDLMVCLELLENRFETILGYY